MANLLVIVYVVCAGMPYAAGTNYRPFAPFGAHGVFTAASIVFFSFIGFDTIATTAEEVRAAAQGADHAPLQTPAQGPGLLALAGGEEEGGGGGAHKHGPGWSAWGGALAVHSERGSQGPETVCSTETHSLPSPQAPG